ncbi:putative chitinase [Chryseobacterium sp. 52]|uniref:glycoside hydrolase family 19 protein n=1 Tax=Chryseobacterium sp. 52 TaxID=2035213 RepID=UPI000C19B13B|nr:glycoside hydrolase family 19 protein [Chryseobacterium sp. 52]PIF46645.1 putative chitinase [Chryseobacterium sp. 52]
MNTLNDDENSFPKGQPSSDDEPQTQNTEDLKAENSQKMEDKRAERAEKDSKSDGLLLAIHGAKVKFNAHLGEFKVLNDVPTTQDKLTGTIVEKLPANFTFYDGFQMISLTAWQDFGTAKVQDNYVLLKKSTLPGIGKMPGNIPPETGKIEFVTSGQVNQPESVDAKGAPVPEQKDDKKCFCDRDFTEENIKSFYNSKKLFTAKNCPLHDEMKTYKPFTDALNKAMKDNNINTCLKKAHFLAQIETESDTLNTTMEYASGWDYDPSTHIDGYNKYKLYLDNIKRKDNPYLANNTKQLKRSYNRYKECLSHGHNSKGDGPKYKGKGLIQLTWKDTYEKYFNHLGKPKLIDSPEVIANDLSYTCDSAAWFWDDRQLGDYADKDDLIFISVRINGGLNGFDHRKNNVKSIIKLMKIEENCTTNKLESLGTYKYETSNIKNLKWGKKNKSKIEKLDD